MPAGWWCSDRFLLSNIVYQGFAGGIDPDEIGAIGRVATGGLLPDLTLVLDVPSEVARSRVGPGTGPYRGSARGLPEAGA